MGLLIANVINIGRTNTLIKYPEPHIKKTAIAFAIVNAMMVSPSEAALISVGGNCLLREAIISANNDNAANNGCVNGNGADTISLSNSVFYSTGFNNGFTATPFINSNITIEGNGHSINRSTTSPNKFRLIAVSGANAALTLNNLTVSGGDLPYGGAGIYVGASTVLNTNNVTITGNNATAGFGGGVLSFGTVSLQNSSLTNNHAADGGGGIAGRRLRSLPRPKLMIQDTTISGNSSKTGGGVSLRDNFTSTDLSIIRSSLLENTATEQGGGLRASRFVIEDSNISDNVASSGGGIFLLEGGGNSSISDSTITGNVALTSLPPGGNPYDLCDDDQVQPTLNWPGYGGGILSRGNPPTLLNTTVSGNDADCGGGIAATPRYAVTFTNSAITNNTARDGGGIFITGYPSLPPFSSASINGGTFSNNYARFGGGIHTRNTRLTLLNMTLHNNSAFNGGGIRADKSSVTISANEDLELNLVNVTLSGNTAGLIGGGLQALDTETAMYNTTIAFNQSTNERDNPGTVNGGGGMRVSVGTRGSLKMRNTIVSGSIGSDCLDRSSNGDIASQDIDDSNLIEDGSCNTQALAVQPRLLPLGDNGGQNHTHELEQSSPAIDAGDNSVCLAEPVNGLDQRGVARPNGNDCDIGAIESQFISDDSNFIVIPLPDNKAVILPL